MICRFFDSSALVKRYMNETESAQVQVWYRESKCMVSSYTYIEVGTALGRLLRRGQLNVISYDQKLERFEQSWKKMAKVQYDSIVMSQAKTLFPLYGLRAGDTVQLASAIVAQQLLKLPIEFVTYDKNLWKAAQMHGFTTLPSGLVIG